MKRAILLSCVFLATVLLSCAKKETINTESPVYQRAELILELDAAYDFDYVAGQRFNCTVKRVIKGLFKAETVVLEISVDPKAKETYAGYLKSYKKYESLVVGFVQNKEVPENISGFKDSKNRYWEILFVAKMANLPQE